MLNTFFEKIKEDLSHFSFFWELFRSVVPPTPLLIFVIFFSWHSFSSSFDLKKSIKFFWVSILRCIVDQDFLYIVDCSLAFSVMMSHLSFVDLNYGANGVLLSECFPAPYLVGLTAVSEFQVPDWSLWTFWSWRLSCVIGRDLISFFVWPPCFPSSICWWWLSLIQCI